MKSNQQLFAEGAKTMRRLLGTGFVGNNGLRMRAVTDDDHDLGVDDDDVNDLGQRGEDDDERDERDDVLVATFGSNHFSRRAKSGKLNIYRRGK